MSLKVTVILLDGYKQEITLTIREVQVLRLVAQAYGSERIGATLKISEGTVRDYLKGIYGKLGLTEVARQEKADDPLHISITEMEKRNSLLRWGVMNKLDQDEKAYLGENAQLKFRMDDLPDSGSHGLISGIVAQPTTQNADAPKPEGQTSRNSEVELLIMLKNIAKLQENLAETRRMFADIRRSSSLSWATRDTDELEEQKWRIYDRILSRLSAFLEEIRNDFELRSSIPPIPPESEGPTSDRISFRATPRTLDNLRILDTPSDESRLRLLQLWAEKNIGLIWADKGYGPTIEDRTRSFASLIDKSLIDKSLIDKSLIDKLAELPDRFTERRLHNLTKDE
jgi:DNA-binding CsgD family transcriptional regulator